MVKVLVTIPVVDISKDGGRENSAVSHCRRGQERTLRHACILGVSVCASHLCRRVACWLDGYRLRNRQWVPRYRLLSFFSGSIQCVRRVPCLSRPPSFYAQHGVIVYHSLPTTLVYPHDCMSEMQRSRLSIRQLSASLDPVHSGWWREPARTL